MTYDAQLSLKGEFLIAMPGLDDPNFSHTVVCICEHTEDGCVGIIINRTYPTLFAKDIFDELNMSFVPEAASASVYFGGPVHMNEMFILHGPPLNGRDLSGSPRFLP
ncbi:DUF179 domain-containing protein [Desulfonema ishimotonii]|uniref:DUF179 domain-containing protein n=1 Tax=Desulfonema ishimotonii TaxID=45657 RepID=A0A401FSR8_9BACT|nr:YqgE/AlgH family protein [Desulfonema ishimotonii]GBC60014.1 DUF179 domain-containing protein [Desulfonema ishimotonii]